MAVRENEAVYRVSSKELESSHDAARGHFESAIFVFEQLFSFFFFLPPHDHFPRNAVHARRVDNSAMPVVSH
jgi:hypothetical protein